MRFEKNILSTLALVALIAAIMGGVQAQQAPVSRVRGVIARTIESDLVVKTRDGAEVLIQVDDKTAVIGLRKIALSDVAPNSFVGVASVPGTDGSPTAVSIHVFPESSRGSNEGSRPYDLRPGSSMTNGAIADRIKAVEGEVVVVKYRDGEKRLLATSSTSVVSFEPGTRGELWAGANVVINIEERTDGAKYASRVLVGRDGLVPAM